MQPDPSGSFANTREGKKLYLAVISLKTFRWGIGLLIAGVALQIVALMSAKQM